MNEWVSVRDRMPIQGRMMAVRLRGGRIKVGFLRVSIDGSSYIRDDRNHNFLANTIEMTDWLYIPEPKDE